MENAKKILITGANGFIGSFLTKEALKKGYEVWAGVREKSNREYLQDPDLRFIDLRYDDPALLNRQIAGHVRENGRWDYVIHNAGATQCARKEDFRSINTHYTIRLAEALQQEGCAPDKFLYMSSLGVLGPGEESCQQPFTLHDKPCPNTAYGQSKLEAEQYLLQQSALPCLILRPTGVYGPREKDYFAIVSMLNKGWSISVGREPQKVDFLYIDDLVDACYRALTSPFKSKVWLLSDGHHYDSEAFVSILKQILGKPRPIHLVFPLWALWVVSELGGFYSRLSGRTVLFNPDKYHILRQRNWTADASDIQRDLGFQAQVDLRAGLEKAIAWYRSVGWLR